MTTTTKCGQCGAAIVEGPATPAEKRTPCPQCGSRSRSFSIQIDGRLDLRSSVSVSATLVAATAPALLLQSVVLAGAKTSEGQLIVAVSLPWLEVIEALKKDPSIAYQISRRKWEEIIAGAYTKAGFDEVTLTPSSGDFGRDVIATKRGLGTVRVVDQVKAYGPNHLVTADDVRALLGVVYADKASKGFLTTTSDFAPRLREDILLREYMPSRIELVNGRLLMERLDELARQR